MEQKYVDMLTLSELYMIQSTVTNKPYMDKGYNCYLFEIYNEAEAFKKKIDNTIILDAKYYRAATICSNLFSQGFIGIKLKKKNIDFVDIPVTEADATKRDYYNSYANRCINRLIQTRQKEYLRNLKDANFLAPILTETRKIKEYPKLFYSYAIYKDDTRYFTLFSTLSEFNEWKETQMYDWKPMELNLKKFGRVRNNSPILINPLTDKLIISDKQCEYIMSYLKGESDED